MTDENSSAGAEHPADKALDEVLDELTGDADVFGAARRGATAMHERWKSHGAGDSAEYAVCDNCGTPIASKKSDGGVRVGCACQVITVSGWGESSVQPGSDGDERGDRDV